MSISVVGARNGNTSVISVVAASGCHVLKVEGYSKTKGALGVGRAIRSSTFNIGGHSWFIRYYPDGGNDNDWISVFLHINNPAADRTVRARYKFSLLDHSGERESDYTKTNIYSFSRMCRSRGFYDFIEKDELESSAYLKNDSFQIRCDITVIDEVCRAEPLTVPPPDLNQHLGALLAGGVGGDVTSHVGGEQLTAHRYVLAARSSVLMAQLFGPMKEKTMTDIQIDDMEAKVFKALLHFIYTDSLPEIDEDETIGMGQHLFVAADRYNMERLKLICADLILKHIDISTAATTLALAEQHGCQELKEGCFGFLRYPGNVKSVVQSDGFEYLKSNYPSLLVELLVEVAP
ncbi:hypothetical protein EJB05_23128, partial [Eragrostis curvula]